MRNVSHSPAWDLPLVACCLHTVFSASDLSSTAIMNKSGQKVVSIHCEIGAGHQYGYPGLVCGAGVLEKIPKDSNLQTFGDIGVGIKRAGGLPHSFRSCKPQLYEAVSHDSSANISRI